MKNNLVPTLARTGDGHAIATLFARVQDAQTLNLTIWSSPLASAFVEDIIAGAEPQLGMKFYTMRLDGEIEGVVCLRNVAGSMFLDNIYLTPRLREMQMGNPFALDCLRHYLQDFDTDEIAWDVWSHERSIIAWHRRLGASEEYRKGCFSVALPAPRRGASIVGREEAKEKHRRYGFSNIDVRTSKGHYKAGLLGDHAFRVTDDASVEDEDFLPALADFDSSRTVYVFSSQSSLPQAAAPIATSIRMRASLPKVLGRLEQYSRTKVESA